MILLQLTGRSCFTSFQSKDAHETKIQIYNETASVKSSLSCMSMEEFTCQLKGDKGHGQANKTGSEYGRIRKCASYYLTDQLDWSLKFNTSS